MSALQLNVYVREAWRCVADGSSSLQPPALETCGRDVTGGRLGHLGASRGPQRAGDFPAQACSQRPPEPCIESNVPLVVPAAVSCRRYARPTPPACVHKCSGGRKRRDSFFHSLALCFFVLFPNAHQSLTTSYFLSRSANAISAALMVDGLDSRNIASYTMNASRCVRS